MAEPTQQFCSRCKKMKSIDNYVGTNDKIFKTCLSCREYKMANRNKTKCEHNRQKSRCKECGGTSICEHNRQKSQCKDCGGSSICIHNREKSRCKECGGASICIHNRVKSRCKECGGAIHITIRIMIKGSKKTDKKYNRYEEDKIVDYDYVKKLIEKSEDKCYYCKCKLQYILYQGDLGTIERLDNSLGHNKGNCVIACKKCNFSRVGDK